MFEDRFTAAEWQRVMSVPFQAFLLVAKADGKVDEAELKEFVDRLTKGAFGYKDELHREIAQSMLKAGTPAVIKQLTTAESVDPEETRDLLRDKLTTDEYQKFMGSLLLDIGAFARASGSKGGLFKKNKKMVSDEEELAFKAWALFWGVDVTKVAANFG